MPHTKSLHFEREKNLKAGGYTLLTAAVLVMLLFIIRWKLPIPPAPLLDEGIEVNLGNSETGTGDIPPMIPGDPAPETEPSVQETAQPLSQPTETTDEAETDDAPDVIPVKTKPVTPENKPRPTTPIPNPAPVKPASKPEPAPPAPPKPKATLGNYSGGNGTGGNNQDAFNNVRNQGIAGGKGDQGKPNGNINSDRYTGNGGTGNSGVAISRGLSGRAISRFPSFEDDFNVNAKIAVDVKVDETGKVIAATYQVRNSTSSSNTLKEIALRKARELKFNSGEGISTGTVIFNFRLKD